MIHYTVTYEKFLPHEDDEDVCEADESGFQEEAGLADFQDMMSLLYATEPSEYPLPESPTQRLWFTRYGEQCFRTGERVNLSYHPATERDARYMLKAWINSNRRTS